MKKILITRPKEQAQEMALELKKMGYESIIAPMLEVAPEAFEVPQIDQYQGILFTSSNAVKAFCEALDKGSIWYDLAVFCVGNKTREACVEHGFKWVKSANGALDDLVSLVADQPVLNAADKRPYLHICGAHVSAPLCALMAEHSIAVEMLVTYRTNQIDRFEPEVVDALTDRLVCCVIHMSPRSAESFVMAIRNHALENTLDSIKSLSISDAVLRCVQSLPWEKSERADQPNKTALYALLKGA